MKTTRRQDLPFMAYWFFHIPPCLTFQKSYILLTRCISVIFTELKTNSIYFLTQGQVTSQPVCHDQVWWIRGSNLDSLYCCRAPYLTAGWSALCPVLVSFPKQQ